MEPLSRRVGSLGHAQRAQWGGGEVGGVSRVGVYGAVCTRKDTRKNPAGLNMESQEDGKGMCPVFIS